MPSHKGQQGLSKEIIIRYWLSDCSIPYLTVAQMSWLCIHYIPICCVMATIQSWQKHWEYLCEWVAHSESNPGSCICSADYWGSGVPVKLLLTSWGSHCTFSVPGYWRKQGLTGKKNTERLIKCNANFFLFLKWKHDCDSNIIYNASAMHHSKLS